MHDAERSPVGIGRAMEQRFARVERVAHRLDAFLPGVVVEHEIAQSRMTCKR